MKAAEDIFNCNTVEYLKDLEQVYDYVKNIKQIDSKNIYLFGSSWGGMVAYNFRRKNDFKSLILHEPTFRWRIENKKKIERWMEKEWVCY